MSGSIPRWPWPSLSPPPTPLQTQIPKSCSWKPKAEKQETHTGKKHSLGTLLADRSQAWVTDSQALEPCLRRSLIPALPWASCQVLPS